jgi:hypothetical protein
MKGILFALVLVGLCVIGFETTYYLMEVSR